MIGDDSWTDDDGTLHVVWHHSDSPSGRGLSKIDTYRELIKQMEASLECMPYETRQAGGEEILAACRRNLAVLESHGDDRGPREP